MNEVHIRTRIRDSRQRLLFVGIALVLRNVWVWLHLKLAKGKWDEEPIAFGYLFFVLFRVPAIGGLLGGIVSNTRHQLFLSALYLYTTKNLVVDGFSEASFQQAFQPR